MLGLFRTKRLGVFAWALMAALVVGLAGFGIGIGGGAGGNAVARVGDESVTADEYIRALQQELRALNAQVGRDVPITEARQYGVDRMVLARLVNDAALDVEARRLGLSAGDDTILAQLAATPAFQGADGKFSREAYVFALERIGLQPGEFEELLRREASRELIAGAVQASAGLPDSAAATVLAFLGERRSFEWLRLGAAQLPAPVPAPTEAELARQHEDFAERYTRPETRRITYAAITPEQLAAGIEIPEDELRAAYDDAGASYRTPERRHLERIGFRTDEEALAARARLDAGEVTFDALAAERGLTPEEIDQGLAAAETLPAEARDAIFGAAGPGIVGPVTTPLGPGLYRINAVLAAETTPFEEVRDDLARSRALETAARQILDETSAIEDLVAGGATAEEIASETVLELGTIALNSATTGGLAADPAFREAAEAASLGQETDLVELADGGLATLRVDAIEPPALLPLAEVRDRVAADWTADRTTEALTELADGFAVELHDGLTVTALAERLGVERRTAGPLARGESVPGAPAELVADIFAADADGTVIRRDGDGVILARLGAVEPFDPTNSANAPIVTELRDQFRTQAADDVLTLYTAALREAAGVRVNQSLVESTLARFQ
jgi:peptidyl-prolyl cis-trans isomerase D